METMEWPQYLQFKQETFPQWTFTLRIVNDQRVTEIEMEDRYHAIYHPYAPILDLRGLKIGQELLADRSSAADALLKVLRDPRTLPGEIDDAVGKYITRMAEAKSRHQHFLNRYELPETEWAGYHLALRSMDLEKKLKKAKGRTRKQIQRAIEDIEGLFISLQGENKNKITNDSVSEVK